MPRGRKPLSEEHKAALLGGREESKNNTKIELKKGYITCDSHGWTLTVEGYSTYYGDISALLKSLPNEYLKHEDLKTIADIRGVLLEACKEIKEIREILNGTKSKEVMLIAGT